MQYSTHHTVVARLLCSLLRTHLPRDQVQTDRDLVQSKQHFFIAMTSTAPTVSISDVGQLIRSIQEKMLATPVNTTLLLVERPEGIRFYEQDVDGPAGRRSIPHLVTATNHATIAAILGDDE